MGQGLFVCFLHTVPTRACILPIGKKMLRARMQGW
jgi:hypothetical protein